MVLQNLNSTFEKQFFRFILNSFIFEKSIHRVEFIYIAQKSKQIIII